MQLEISQVDPNLTLFLIREELKSRKFFRGLQKVGLDYTFYQPHLDDAILASVGLIDDSDETFNRYTRLMDKHARKITEDRESITRQAMKVYRVLRSSKLQKG